jgi:myo-inositol 2-dehydrogenase / D-chiro-inositol 1-dehydrogenase
MADISIGVIGTGGMGSRHVQNLQRYVKGANVVAVYDLDQARARQVAEECGGVQAFSDPLQLIQDAGVDAVVVASPDPTHAEFVHACLRSRKPVLCEKPLATTAEAALRLGEKEQALGQRLIAVGFMRRFDPQHVAVHQMIKAGKIGRPILFKGVHRNPMNLPYPSGSGAITNSAIHDIDSMRWLLGQEVREVYVCGARTHSSFDEETRDMLLMQMSLGGDCLATIEVSIAAEYGYEVSAEVVGERGTAVTMQPDSVLLRAGQMCAVTVPQSHLVRFQQAYVPELTAWVESIQSGQPFPGANAWDGYMSLLVADACIQSLQRGTPVSVSAPEKSAFYQQQGEVHAD